MICPIRKLKEPAPSRESAPASLVAPVVPADWPACDFGPRPSAETQHSNAESFDMWQLSSLHHIFIRTLSCSCCTSKAVQATLIKRLSSETFCKLSGECFDRLAVANCLAPNRHLEACCRRCIEHIPNGDAPVAQAQLVGHDGRTRRHSDGDIRKQGSIVVSRSTSAGRNDTPPRCI